MTKGAFRVELQGFIGDRHIDRFGKGTWEVGPPRSSRKGGCYNAWPIDGGEMLLARDLDELHDHSIESVYLGPLTSDVTDDITDDELLGGVFECEGQSFTVRADDLVCIWQGGREEPQFMLFRPRGATTGGAVPADVKPEKRPAIGPLPPPKKPK